MQKCIAIKHYSATNNHTYTYSWFPGCIPAFVAILVPTFREQFSPLHQCERQSKTEFYLSRTECHALENLNQDTDTVILPAEVTRQYQ